MYSVRTDSECFCNLLVCFHSVGHFTILTEMPASKSREEGIPRTPKADDFRLKAVSGMTRLGTYWGSPSALRELPSA
jgi:hypothetical protein